MSFGTRIPYNAKVHIVIIIRLFDVSKKAVKVDRPNPPSVSRRGLSKPLESPAHSHLSIFSVKLTIQSLFRFLVVLYHVEPIPTHELLLSWTSITLRIR